MLTPLQLGQAAHAVSMLCLAIAQEQLRAEATGEEAGQLGGLKRMRRNGWHLKPRNYLLYGRSEEGREAWEHNAARSNLWLYINTPADSLHSNALFKKATGIDRWLYEYYMGLLKGVPGFGEFEENHPKRARQPQPLAMKICAWAMILTKGCTFIDASVLCCISSNVIRRFFHKLNTWLVANEYAKHVYPPTAQDDVANVEKKFALMGFPGAITCIDATHVVWLNCPAVDCWRNTGKDGCPTRSFNCAVGPSREFHHVHASHPGAHNDKTISRFDQYMTDIRFGKLYGSFN